ncbi:hypothetical protein SASPL_139486 [Salvia splendens]|uniref:Uncharacterized protein n=1 Tax=Salvia splendens TaxID=180675 RepID=A0A8X8ZAQ4_SALSN|nr:hypothetical protein SASPL_139486 [Salvia splendens]
MLNKAGTSRGKASRMVAGTKTGSKTGYSNRVRTVTESVIRTRPSRWIARGYRISYRRTSITVEKSRSGLCRILTEVRSYCYSAFNRAGYRSSVRPRRG